MAELTMEEVKNQRRGLEDFLLTNLRKFEEFSGTRITSIYIRRADCFASASPIRDVELTVEVTRF